MKTIRKLKWYFLFLILIGLDGSGVFAQDANGPISNYTSVVYLNLDAGDVTITASSFKGYRWSGNGQQVEVSGAASSSTLYYIYQTKPNTNWGPGNPPQYPAVTTTSGATGSNALNIVNNTNVMNVINGWNTKVNANNNAQSNNNYKRYPTSHKISVRCHSRINICLDNVWSTFQTQSEGTEEGGLSFMPSHPDPTHPCQLNVYLKGDNRLGNVYYCTNAIPAGGEPEDRQEYTNAQIIFRSAEGNGKVSGTLTVADIDPVNEYHYFTLPNTNPNAQHYTIKVPGNHYNAVIGASDTYQSARGIVIKGGTIFAGAVFDDNCTAIGAGGNGVGIVTIDGGQVTAVTSSTGTAIGGGIGWIAVGGEGHVTINGGKVYAYNHGVAYVYDDHLRYVPATAIGGGSSFAVKCNPCTVTITGGEVYAQSVGGVTIGGGGSGLESAGDGTVNISGGKVTARSIPGTITSPQMPAGMQTISVPAGAALGGGTGGLGTAYGGAVAYGGNATVNISGGQLFAGSVGGGAANDPNGKIGSATVTISGGTSQAQFIMAGGSTSHCSYTQTNGTVQNSSTSSTEFILLKPNGGALWMDDPLGTASISGGTIRNCSATNGGAIYMTGGSFTMSGGTVGGSSLTNGNKAASKGGALYMGGGTFEMTGGNIQYNTATGGNGGGFYVTGGTVEVKGGTITENTAQVDGGGFYVNVSNASIETKINSSVASTTISNNTATTGNGGGVYVSNGKVTIDNATLSGNQATAGNGGGICINSSSATNQIDIKNGTKINGTNKAKNGAGVYVAQGAVTIEGASTQISGNQATQNGGGICSMGGTITINNGATIGGTKTVSGSTVADGNTAVNGGGIYASSDIEFTNGTISNNTATNGGGLYIPQCTATLDFTSGTFTTNYASSQGGGIYISQGAVLNMQGVASLSGNHVPATGQGGGIYMNGTLNVGGGTGTQSMRCNDNYAGTSYSLATQNNVYLPSRTKYITLKSDISHKTGGVYDTQIGITVNPTLGSGSIPVVYVEDATNEPWLQALMADISTAGGAVFDDTQHYIAIHTRRNVGDFNKQFIYFADCWTTVVTTDPGESHIKLVGDTYHIYTNQGLAWFSSLVNGLNRGTAANQNQFNGPQPQLKAKLEADVDMSQNLWVPLGAITAYNSTSSTFTESATQGYTGEFDGQGYIIKGIRNGYLTGITRYGLFGSVGNGTVKNTFLDAYTNLAVNTGVYYMGGVSGTATGNAVISNSEARGAMDLTEAAAVSYVGGIVGLMDGSSQIHSCMAMPDLTFKNTRAGGLAGQTNSGTSVKNSFANGSYTPVSNTVIGGLVGWNNGTVENCYVRLQGTEPSNFGWFAGNNEGSIQYCYAPRVADESSYDYATSFNYVGNPETSPTITEPDNYGTTLRYSGKYGFKHRDHQMKKGNTTYEKALATGKASANDTLVGGLQFTLNRWVNAKNTTTNTYSTWTRTMASPINDDLPILEFDDFVSAGSTDNVFIAYRDDLNDMIDYANANSTGGSVYLYDATPTAVNKNTNANVRVYIDPNVGITQAANNILNARVGVTLDNSSTDFMAYDWHMFSSALRAAPMGLVYHSQETGYEGVSDYNVRINYENYAANGIPHTVYQNTTYMDPPKTTWNHTAGQIGYFPTDAPYGDWRGTPDSQGSFDFYCFHEPSRHWINFKREGREGFYDHWNQYVYNPATDKHTQIQYPNETAMVSGKGYMVALSQPSMMMADGVLNNTATQSSNASYNEGSGYDQPLRGLNLVGNPYQSYLDFDLFAQANGIDTYYILDADAKGYIAYTTGATPQESDWPNGVKSYTADQYIHPHQGFFVRVDAAQPISFNSDMRKGGTNTSSVGSDYRDWEPRYALVNMVCTDGGGRNDFATIELDRPEQGGGRKAKGLRSGDASIWFRLGDEDYQIAFAPVGTQSAALRFEAHTDGVYTLRWNMQNADFGYLHLIDNLTGADIDCLTTDEYRFEAKTSDYTSRFRLVFEFTGVDEPEAPEPVEGPTSFAFMMGDELVINGEGVLQMFDLNGRQLFSTEIHGTQATVAMPKVADGIYVLRLTNGNQVRTQKMVINK